MSTPLDYAAQIAYSSKETLQFTYDMAVKYRSTDGCYVECGVAAGAQIIAMAYAAPNKQIYAFDSFAGIPLPSNKDDQYPGWKYLDKYEQSLLPEPGKQELKSSGATVVSLEDFLANIKTSGTVLANIRAVKGWFEETVHLFKMPISILRLDGDLYNSTLVCLRHMEPLVVEGGIIIIDDWELQGCKQAVLDYYIGKKFNLDFISNIAYIIK